ncbi:hypothetical protein P3L51_00620 [Streptomyces sp. PSRA5]|uniref:hypothetical protein n=1 Tax=Streptomyces panacea TaxID=3035064 RepID=UPI00339BA50F
MSTSEPEPPEPKIDVSYLLHAAELPLRDPRLDGYGPLHATAARGYARAMDRDIRGSPHLKGRRTAPDPGPAALPGALLRDVPPPARAPAGLSREGGGRART